MSPGAKFVMAMTGWQPNERGAWLAPIYRRLVAQSVVTKSAIVLLTIVVVGYADYISGAEVSVSILYLVPIAYASWFIRARAGLLAAVICATIWFTIEVTFVPAYSHPLIPIWNAGVRLGFFFLGVFLVALVKRTEVHLLQEVSRQTKTLHEESERRRRLEREVIEVAAREQMRMAQDLHDGLGQYLSALTFHARMLADDLRQEQSSHTLQAERMIEIIRRTNQITRRLDRALRLPESGAGGLLASIRALATEFEQLTGVRCEIEVDAPVLSLDDFRTLMLFRIVQEACSNSVKHGNPRLIRVHLRVNGEQLAVKISNDGQDLSSGTQTESGTGLRIMKLRAEMIGAEVHMHPRQPSGYEVECILPISALERGISPATGAT